jgi:hypothetical protein
VPGFHSFKHRTGGFRCQTTICECVRVDHRAEQKAREIKKEKTRETRSSDFLFLGSTDPVANERLFLERFTSFQQGQTREYATLATQPPCAVEPVRKSKHHFA